MPAKKATQNRRSIRYLLSADRKLQRLSLKKMSGVIARPRSSSRSGHSRTNPGANRSWQFPGSLGTRAILIGVIGLVAGAALIGARQPAHSDGMAAVGPTSAAPDQITTQSPPPELKKTRAPKTTTAGVRNATSAKAAPLTPPIRPTAKPATTSAESSHQPEAAPPKAAPLSADTVTITGCVVADDDTFWLKDTSGVEAPKSRSWKSGFLKKSPSRVELVDANHTLRFSQYSGQRVAATGLLVDREMRVRSLQRVAGSCN